MKDTARILKIGAERVLVEPLLKDTCINCSTASACAKRGKPFSVSNPRNFVLHPGSVVRVRASIKHQGLQALVSLILPLLAGLCGYYACGLFVSQPSEAVRVAGVFICFAVVTALVLWLSRRSPFGQRTAEICEVLTNNPEQVD